MKSMNHKRSNKRVSLISIAIVLIASLSLGPVTVLASGPQGADYDNEPTNLVADLLNILTTLPFNLGEVDVSTLGVSDTDPDLVNSGMYGYDSTDPTNDQAAEATPDTDPTMRIVDDDHMDCPNAQYTHIQDAIDAANPGDKIKVCRGTYVEQVLVNKNNLTLFSVPHFGAVIKAPPAMTVVTFGTTSKGMENGRSIVTVRGAQGVLIRHFIITGPSTNIFAGVRVDGGGSATIRQNQITQIQTSPFGVAGPLGFVEGNAVAVGRFAEGQVGTAVVRHNHIDNYQKTGVFVDNLGTYAEVRQNEIIGSGPINMVAQNGIQISRNAKAVVRHNKVSQNDFESCGCDSDTDAVGILTQDENRTDCPMGTCNSIMPVDTNLLNVHHNKSFMNKVGIGLGRATNQGLFDHNHPHDNVKVGLRAYGFTKNGGMTSPEAQQNTISYNLMQNNKLDCSDQTTGNGTATTANFWIKDKGATEDVPGICKQ